MANSRQDEKTPQSARDAIRRLSQSTAEETRRMGETAAEVGQNLVGVGANVMQLNAEMVQTVLRSGLDMTTTVMGRSTDQFSRTLGLTGDEAHTAAERSTHSAASILHSTSTAARAMSGMSQEYLAFMKAQVERGMDCINELSRCRSPQDFAAIQADFLGQSLQSAIESGRRIADISVKVVDEAKTLGPFKEERAA